MPKFDIAVEAQAVRYYFTEIEESIFQLKLLLFGGFSSASQLRSQALYLDSCPPPLWTNRPSPIFTKTSRLPFCLLGALSGHWENSLSRNHSLMMAAEKLWIFANIIGARLVDQSLISGSMDLNTVSTNCLCWDRLPNIPLGWFILYRYKSQLLQGMKICYLSGGGC